ncbi:T4 family baseplate hub assembly chaperone [Desulfogranum japonicum]|uniref:T4 family baseplate hub assembly chaperone n=1 Tax=Desulfogranum japonicum TaxID=231447 RepID=UPI000402535C|nr:hypothetical protein [Desulfogranum japonicum]
MVALSCHELLRVWEAGHGSPPYRRALLLLSASSDNEKVEDLASLNIGCRDARLLALREELFGQDLLCLAQCPACGERLEFSLTTNKLQAAAGETLPRELQVDAGEYTVVFRLPTSQDLMALEGQYTDTSSLQSQLLRRCLLGAQCGNEKTAFADLPNQVIEEVIARMESADPAADIQLALTCPGCAHRWQALFDIVAYLWHEIHTWAIRMIREVHLLASTYGWHEADILAMSPQRRNLYLELIGT